MLVFFLFFQFMYLPFSVHNFFSIYNLVKMSEKPYLKELKDICCSDKLHEMFKFLNIQEILINEVNMINGPL